MHKSRVVRNKRCTLANQSCRVSQIELPNKIAGVFRPNEGRTKITILSLLIRICSDHDDVRKPLRQFSEPVPLFPRPIGFTPRVYGNCAWWQLKITLRRTRERSRERSDPAQVTGHCLNAPRIPVFQPLVPFKDLRCPRPNPSLQLLTPISEQTSIVDRQRTILERVCFLAIIE